MRDTERREGWLHKASPAGWNGMRSRRMDYNFEAIWCAKWRVWRSQVVRVSLGGALGRDGLGGAVGMS
ncbi:hypothetical protein NL676_003418 [Syzygium grande]|nr:hypothetical protein NL676_003418 [Syzygium grande]